MYIHATNIIIVFLKCKFLAAILREGIDRVHCAAAVLREQNDSVIGAPQFCGNKMTGYIEAPQFCGWKMYFLFLLAINSGPVRPFFNQRHGYSLG